MPLADAISGVRMCVCVCRRRVANAGSQLQSAEWNTQGTAKNRGHTGGVENECDT